MACKIMRGFDFEFVWARKFLILWISTVIYISYDTFIYYRNGRQFYHIRQILGLGLCLSRATATVLNVCGAMILLPQCKKLNQLFYKMLSKLCPGLFFFWLEKAKSIHMTVATTLVIFGVLHSISHFVNLCSFSRGFDEQFRDINFASYKNENPFYMLLNTTCLTGVLMLSTTLLMGVTSLRIVRRKLYNAFWYSHQLYLPFMVLFLIHPLSGVLKQEIISDSESHLPSLNHSQSDGATSLYIPRFMAIESKTWLWMSLPLTCFFIDLLWRIFSRNRAIVDILEVRHMSGRTLSLRLSCPEDTTCREGQYVVLQCPQVSLLEWHPFTIVKVPTINQNNFLVWIRVKGDWTEALEKLLKETGPRGMNILVDGPFSSPMESVSSSEIAICIAAGVGITPFVAVLHKMLLNPRSHYPVRIHLLWIVRHEQEISWLAELADKTIRHLRDANRPDRLHLQLYVTQNRDRDTHIILNKHGRTSRVLTDDEKSMLLTPNLNRGVCDGESYSIAQDYPLLGCRVRRGRPHWDQVFGYWVHLYPEQHLNLFCCGPKKLVKILREKCKATTINTQTKFDFIHEGFS